MKSLPSTAALCLAAATGPLFAATPTPEIFVTATRGPVAADKLPAAVSTLRRADIERLQVRSVPELLRGIPGIDLTESGGLGKTTSLFLRGTEADQVLVLIDGVRIGSASVGLPAFELLPVEHIERIEIVRGPRASQWGSEAIGGVIHIFTRRGSDDPGVEISGGAGSYGTYRVTGGIGDNPGNSHYRIAGGYLDTDGFDAREPVPGPFGFDQPDDDGFDSRSVHLRAGHRFENGVVVDGLLLRASGNTEFDGGLEDQTDFVQQVLGARAEFRPHTRWQVGLQAGESRDETDNFTPAGVFSSQFDTRRRELSWLNTLDLTPGQTLTLGVDYRREEVDSSSDFSVTERDNTGVLGQYLAEFGDHVLLASVRHDDNESFDTETTGGLGWRWRATAALGLFGSYGTAFKAPSFNELYFPGFGNPNLGAETSESFEAGIEGRHPWGQWSLRGYHTDVDDLIVTVQNPLTGEFFPDNVARARLRGIEAELSARLGDWNGRAAVSLVDSEDRDSGNRLPRRTEETASLEITRDWSRLSAGVNVLAQGHRFDDAANTVRLSGYATVALLASYRLHRQWLLRARVGNLFDREYQTVAGFNSPDRNVFVSLHYQRR